MKMEIFVNIFTKTVLAIRIVYNNYNIKLQTNLDIKNPVFRYFRLKIMAFNTIKLTYDIG